MVTLDIPLDDISLEQTQAILALSRVSLLGLLGKKYELPKAQDSSVSLAFLQNELFEACYKTGNLGKVLEVLAIAQKRGALKDVINYTTSGGTPLQNAVANGYIKIAAVLIKYGANVNLQCDWLYGSTALDTAINKNKMGMAYLLLSAGADPTKADNNGKYPHEKSQNLAMQEFLFKAHSDKKMHAVEQKHRAAFCALPSLMVAYYGYKQAQRYNNWGNTQEHANNDGQEAVKRAYQRAPRLSLGDVIWRGLSALGRKRKVPCL